MSVSPSDWLFVGDLLSKVYHRIVNNATAPGIAEGWYASQNFASKMRKKM